EPRDRRHHRRRTRSDDKSARTDAMLARLDGALVNESGFGLDHAHTETGEALDRIIGCDLCDNAADMIADALPINAGRDSLNTKAVAATHDVRTLGRGDQRFRGYTAIVEAVAAHLVLFDQHYAPAQCSASSSYGQPTRSRPDDAQIGGDHIAASSRELSRRPAASSEIGRASCREG